MNHKLVLAQREPRLLSWFSGAWLSRPADRRYKALLRKYAAPDHPAGGCCQIGTITAWY